jgi:predicted phosphodiesterase
MIKILCAGDLHLGRRSSRLPPGADGRAHSATAAWHALVDHAIRERVDLVALSGDLVDRANRYFEAFGPLERGIRRLGEAQIHVAAVAGNHDFDVLPKLAPSLGKNFHLLGAGGRWQAVTVPTPDGKPALHLAGWSFPETGNGRVPESPMAGFPRLPNDGVPSLGLLHADLDQPKSPYAPVRSDELRARPVSFWLLGHVHVPRLHQQPGGPPLLYPGTPQALDPGESGAHGAWMLELAPGRLPAVRQVPLSSVRYDVVEADVTGIADPDALDRRVAEAVRAHTQRVVEEGCGPLRHLSCRVRVTGCTPLHHALERRLRERATELDPEHGDVRARVERIDVATWPVADLDALAATPDAPGVLARLVLGLDSGRLDPGQERLVAELSARAGDVHRATPYQLLADPLPAPDELRALARRQAMLLLDTLLAQKEAA